MDNTTVTDLRCTVSRILFADDIFVICSCTTKERIPPAALTGLGETGREYAFTAVGYGIPAEKGRKICLSGEWEISEKFRRMQLRVSDCVDFVGHSEEEIVAYLSSSILKGIGKATAKKIYDEFGEKTISVIKKEPERLLAIPGINKKKLEKIVASFEERYEFHNLTLLLAKYNISYATIVRIKRHLGSKAVQSIKDNPYVLCRVPGIGFKTADALALEMGIAPNSPLRISGAIFHVLEKARSDGHMFLPYPQLIKICCDSTVLNNNPDEYAIDQKQVVNVLYDMVQDEALMYEELDGTYAIYGKRAHTHETFVAAEIATRLTYHMDQDVDWPTVVAQTANSLGVKLDEKQAEAAVTSLSRPLSVITGGPGTGKTTSLRVIVESYKKAHPDREIALAAPTGRAARRMAEQVGMQAATLHKFLGLAPEKRTYFNVSPCASEYRNVDLLIVDESSMIDTQLLAELLYRLLPKTQVIFLGDANQLPSVGAGNVLSQLLSNQHVPNVKLEKIFRQSEDSVIPVNAAKIRNGDPSLEFTNTFHLLYCNDEEEGAEKICQLVEHFIDRDAFNRAQILCPMKSRGATCTRNLNKQLHDIVNPPNAYKREATVGPALFRVGDKVMQTVNTDEIPNGEIGYIVDITGDASDRENFSLVVQFEADGCIVNYSYEDALDLIPALAITIHKSQGSEFDAVIVPMFKSMSFFLRRNLFYTAVTRAKKAVYIVSDGAGVEIAIRREDTSKRHTLLSSFIYDELKRMRPPDVA